MTYVITQACCNDASCVPACPVNAIHPTPDEPDFGTAEMLYIDPQGCIDCGACVSVCPVGAIAADYELPAELAAFEQLNAVYYEDPVRSEYDPHPIDSPVRRWTTQDDAPLRVAVVGGGPAGFFVAEELLTARGLDVQVDMFERLPVPTGLARFGVAPDHQTTKSVMDGFARTMRRAGFGLFLDVEVGRDISHEQLSEYYHAVVYAVGVDGDRTLGIPGEDLPGSHAAADFVAWYNGHPDYQSMSFDLSSPRAVVVGNGNVALDVARVLLTPVEKLRRTDIADHALEALERSAVREVVVLGRRGPNQAAFTVPELLGLDLLEDVDLRLHPESASDVDSWMGLGTDPIAAHKARLIAGLKEPVGHGREVVLRFHASPVELLGSTRVEGLRLARTQLVPDGSGGLRSKVTHETDLIECGLTLRAVGFRGRELAGVPFDVDRGTIPSSAGRVVEGTDGKAVPGVYVAGWAKRGSSGVIGTNKRCAKETVASLLEDYEGGRLSSPLLSGIENQLPQAIGLDGWQRVDEHERAAGRAASRPRVKVVNAQQLRALGANTLSQPWAAAIGSKLEVPHDELAK